MASDELGLFSYEVLALVGRGGASAHDLRRLAQEVRMVAWAGESQYYVEPKRLARLGYLETRKAPGRTRERTVYTLTDKGREAIRAYARTPVRFTPFKSDPCCGCCWPTSPARTPRARASPRCAPTSTS